MPAAEYKCVVEKCTSRKSKNNNEMNSLQLKVIEGRYENRKIFDNIFVDEEFLAAHQFAFNKLISLLKACGFRAGENEGDEFSIPPTQEFLAKELYVQVAIDKNDSSKNMVFHYYAKPYSERPKKNSKGVVVQGAVARKPLPEPIAGQIAKDDEACPF